MGDFGHNFTDLLTWFQLGLFLWQKIIAAIGGKKILKKYLLAALVR